MYFFPAQYKEMGYQPQAMVIYLALLGWGDGTENEFFTIDDLGLFLIFFFLSFSLQFFNIKLKENCHPQLGAISHLQSINSL